LFLILDPDEDWLHGLRQVVNEISPALLVVSRIWAIKP
jgi:hypothetical protein